MKEQIPNWLKLLLAKYGEEQGPLIGLDMSAPDEVADDFYPDLPGPGEADSSPVSNLLEQMAEAPTPLSSERTSTSVEWGAPPAEEPASPIDDLLANFDADANAYQPAYEMAASEPATTTDDDDVPDWLSDALDASPTEMPHEESLVTPSTPLEADDVPDWLSAALEEPVTDTPEQPPAAVSADDDLPDWLSTPAPETPPPSPEPEGVADDSVPDWLSKAVSSGPVVDETSVAPTDDDFDTPDWLSQEVAVPTPPAEPSSTPHTLESDVPDWITDRIEDTSETEDKPISAGEIPDWIGSPSSFEEENLSVSEPELADVPDWLGSHEEEADVGDTQAQAEPSPPDMTAEPAGLGWLSDLRAGMMDNRIDETDEPEAEVEPFDEDEAPELPAWLMGTPATPAAQQPPASPASPEPIASESPDIPDWLVDETLDTSPDTLSTEKSPWPTAATADESPITIPDTDSDAPDWLRDELPDSDTAAESEPEPEIPAWLMDVEPPQPQREPEPEPEAIETPNWLTDLQETETDEGKTSPEPELPDWLADVSIEPEDSLDQPETTAPLPDWLAGETSEDDTPAPGSEQQIEDTEPPSWLAGLRQTRAEMMPDLPADEPVDDVEAPNWLADLPEATVEDTPEAEPELPDWLVGVETEDEGLPAADTVAEAPDWLTDLPEAESPSPTLTTEEEPQTPDWLTESLEDDTGTPSPIDDSVETPDWLSDLSETPDFVADEEAISPVEPDMPDWLMGEPAISSEPVSPPEVTGAGDEGPAWLADLAETGDDSGPVTESESVAAPDWLADLQDTAGATPSPETESITDETTVDDEEPAAPDWLSNLRSTEDAPDELDETDDWLADLPEAETETPDWLTGLSTETPDESDQPPASDEAGDEVAMPDWLADVSATDQIETAIEAVPPSLEQDEEPPEAPDWLSNLRGSGTMEAALPDEPETLDEEPAAPDWLTELPDMPTDEPTDVLPVDVETPDWLADLPDASSDEPPEPIAEAPGDMESLGWSSEEIETTTIKETPIEEEAELPDWLAELPQAADTGELDEAAIPDWLSELPQAPNTGQLESSEALRAIGLEMPSTQEDVFDEPEDDETAAPSWLTDLRPDDETDVEDEAAAPAWLSELQAVDADEPAIPEPAGEDLTEAPDWLSEMSKTATEEKPGASVPSAELPSWLAELPEAPNTGLLEAQTMAIDEPIETPDWLRDLPEAPDTGELESIEPSPAEPAVPVDQTEEEAEAPDWLAELPDEAEAPSALDEADEADGDDGAPSWLTGLRQADRETSFADDDETESPDWLADLPPAIEPDDDLDAQTEAEAPDWLTKSDEPAEIDAELATSAQVEIPAQSTDVESEDLEAPSWLADLQSADDNTTSTPAMETMDTVDAWGDVSTIEEDTTEAESDIPAWLTELPDVTETDEDEPLAEKTSAEGVAEEVAVDLPELPDEEVTSSADEIEAPSWLTGLRQAEARTVPDTETAESLDEALPDEVEAPDWLADLPSAEETGSDEDELEAPDWLAEATPDTQEETTPGEDELETPDWLADVTAEAQPDTVEAAPVEELDWLADLSGDDEAMPDVETSAEDSAPDIESSPWLAELQNTADLEATDTADTAEVEELDWLTDLSTDAVEPETTAEPSSAEGIEAPDWLAELGSDSPADEAAETPADDLFASEPATPDWLADLDAEMPDLPDLAETTTALEAPAESTAVEGEDAAPDWLSGPMPDEAVVDEAPSLEPAPDEFETPDWLAEELKESPSIEPSPPTVGPTGEIEPAIPDWLDEATQDTLPLTATDLPDRVEAEPAAASQVDEDGTPPPPAWMTGLREATQAVKSALPDEEADSFETFVSPGDAVEPSLAEESGSDWDIDEPPAETPDWLKDLDESADDLPLMFEPDTVEADEVIGLPPTATPSPTAPAKSETPANVPGWLQNLRPSESKGSEAVEPDETAESTGVLTGLTALMPAEKLETPTVTPDASFLSDRPEALRAAAQQFYAIATQSPQPVTLPETLAQPKPFAINLPRLVVYLLFILLIALPLLPGLRAADRGRSATWTEPVGSLSEELDKQRRQMISEPLGIIDQQPPGAVALVSFDFTTATQGEMRPLAEAIIGRLKGQGMRLIFISLEPEGSSLAQQMIDQLLAERGETYGENVVNLGYIPGQVAGVRDLLSGENALATQPDIQGLTFESAERTAWADIRNLDQVNLIVTIADNPASARWWIEQLALVPEPADQERFLLAATSALAAPFLQPYQANDQVDGVIAGINGAAAIEAGRRDFGPARQMLDSQSIAHLLMVIIIAAGTIAGWMPPLDTDESPAKKSAQAPQPEAKEE